jgi:pimeloyl-ACP methyl ester carboxylesterase
MRFIQAVVPFAAAFAVVYALLCGWMYATQRLQMYFPTPPTEAARAQAWWVERTGERIKVWVVARPGPSALLYFGGNAEDVAGTVDTLIEAIPDHSLYLVNYRGYGGSTGRPTEAGLREDALAIYDELQRRHEDVAVMGRSLGSGVAVQLASERPVERLVLVTAFDSLADVAASHFPWLPVRLLLKDRYESAARAHDVGARVLLVTAVDDEIIPSARSDALAAAFQPGQVERVVVPAVGHNTLDLSPAYLDAVRRFLLHPAKSSD